MVQNLDGYCPFELKAGLGVLGAGLGVQGAQAVRRAALGAGAGRAGRWASRRRALAHGTGRHAGRRARGAREAGERQRRWGAQAAEARRRWGGRRWGAGACWRWRARDRASGRDAGGTVRAGHGRQAARARSLCAQAGPAGPGWGFVHPAWFSACFFFFFF